ncbi:hypothetical protein [Rhodococcus artemisiae]|uniref:Uncharacterized protein n=1 Tax=Rhodococcus artemisiae TaxID=714159 RepID=A0ABU7LJ01_9NOCA|nr:hypothetical protein [Rhodococcus artemisiae]MEE2061523.1 hypothetical protein [Rhodococcus artemisiae]
MTRTNDGQDDHIQSRLSDDVVQQSPPPGRQPDPLTRLHDLRTAVGESLRPAVDHAIALALEAEHLARRTSAEFATAVEPAFPPLVRLLADAAPDSGSECAGCLCSPISARHNPPRIGGSVRARVAQSGLILR